MKSTFYQPTNPFPGTTPCPAGRTEQQFDLHRNGYVYQFVMRDKVVPEDPYLVLIKAYAFSVRFACKYPGGCPPRPVLDFLIKQQVLAV